MTSVRDTDWEQAVPHYVDNVPVLAKVNMLLALAGLSSIREEGIVRLKNADEALRKGFLASEILEMLAKDTGGEEDDDSDDFDNDADDEDSDFEEKHPRWPAGSPDSTGGEFRSKDDTDADIPAEAALFDVGRSDSMSDNSFHGPFDIPRQEFTDYPANPVYATYDDGTVIRDPQTQIPILIPPGVSLNDNVDFGRSIANLSSVITGPFFYDSPEKEIAMTDQFAPGGGMDYQRLFSDQTDSKGNVLINKSYIDIGNYNYGVVGAAEGYTLDQLLTSGAIINWPNIFRPQINTSGLYYSNPRVNHFTTLGYQDYMAGRIKGSNE